MEKLIPYFIVDVSSLLIEATTDELQRSAVAAFPATTKRQHSADTINVANITYDASIRERKTKSLKIKGLAVNNGKKYDMVIQFDKVVYEPTDTPNNVTFLSIDGQDYHIVPISTSTHNAKVSCTCLDFHHRFALWNFNDKSLYGRRPRMYRRKTTTRPPANPTHSPGLCKHLMKFVTVLQRTGLLVK